VGKLVAAFVFFLAASALAVHEAKPPAPPRVRDEFARPVVETPAPSRAIHDEVPPWVKYAAPPAAAPSRPAPATVVITQTPPRRIIIEESTIELVDAIDVIDKCPDQLVDGEDNDGCPEPEQLKNRIIEIE
jgi:hypothetical protein